MRPQRMGGPTGSRSSLNGLGAESSPGFFAHARGRRRAHVERRDGSRATPTAGGAPAKARAGMTARRRADAQSCVDSRVCLRRGASLLSRNLGNSMGTTKASAVRED
jgi:hypothetical protein